MNKLAPKIDNSIRDPIVRYSSIIPDIISDAISGLNKRNYRAVIALLDIEGTKSFTEIREKLNLEKTQSNKLAYWLDKLEEEGLIVNDIIKIPNKKESSFYSLSAFGEDLLDKLLEAYWDYISPIVKVTGEEIYKDVEPTSSDISSTFTGFTRKLTPDVALTSAGTTHKIEEISEIHRRLEEKKRVIKIEG